MMVIMSTLLMLPRVPFRLFNAAGAFLLFDFVVVLVVAVALILLLTLDDVLLSSITLSRRRLKREMVAKNGFTDE